jgi:hypothetical protein
MFVKKEQGDNCNSHGRPVQMNANPLFKVLSDLHVPSLSANSNIPHPFRAA